jgi:methylmalonyl-CoA carboxyltransferase 12S subunit
MSKTTVKDLAEILERIRTQLVVLSERVERLEAAPPKPEVQEEALAVPSAPEPQPAAPEPVRSEITEEELLAISAALGAYLGVRIRIKQIRLLSSHAWAQQGRVSIQASHNLHN